MKKLSQTSEQEFSEASNMSQESPYSSPSQQIPHLAKVFSGITCNEAAMSGKKLPHLRILEQPQNYFRFRYRSEMVGTHGCLLGQSSMTSKNKTHPTVELMNCTGNAIIKCQLYQADCDAEHPHKILDDDQPNFHVSASVPVQGSYKVCFAGMGIIHTVKKDVPTLLFQKLSEKSDSVNGKALQAYCEQAAKTINLNVVRLKFSAHDVITDNEICPPIFSERIHNIKSPEVNDLKICRLSRCIGRPRGGDDVFIFVEKVNRKNIAIRFYELDAKGEECWSAHANFLPNDVHHQFAIAFRTPPYRDPKISKDVTVLMELVRPSDGKSSEPKEFVYKADQLFKHNSKKRRINSPYSSIGSSTGSMKSLSDLPATMEIIDLKRERANAVSNIPVFHIEMPSLPQMPEAPTSSNDLVAEALYYSSTDHVATISPMLSRPNIPEPPELHLTSTELERLIFNDKDMPSEEKKRICEIDWTDYMQTFSWTDSKTSSMDFLRTSMQLVADSGRGKNKTVVKTEKLVDTAENKPINTEQKKLVNLREKTKGNDEYDAYYNSKDGEEVKMLVKQICNLIKEKDVKVNMSAWKPKVIKLLERLCDIRLSNGDTFLHMAISTNNSSFEFLVKVIVSVKMTHLLNLTNDLQQSILHLAVIHDLPRLVTFLVSKGCDPMLQDIEGNTVLHYAVVCQSCLDVLLDAIKTYDVPYNLNAYNFEKQTALHLAAMYDSARSTELLLVAGADTRAADAEGRAALHLAAYDRCVTAAAALLLTCDIDALDGRGNTALQIVCGSPMHETTLEFAKMLLEKKADPMKHEQHNEPAWRLAANKPELLALLSNYATVPEDFEYDIKSEPEDDFESADEGSTGDFDEVLSKELATHSEGYRFKRRINE